MNDDQGTQVHLNTFDPVLFASTEGKELCFPVIVEPIFKPLAKPLEVKQSPASVTNKFRVIPVEYSRRGIALQVYYTPKLIEKQNLFFEKVKEVLPSHVFLPGTFLSIRGDNWEFALHPPVAAALLIVGLDGLLYLKRDGEKRKELNPSFVDESIVEIAMKIKSIY